MFWVLGCHFGNYGHLEGLGDVSGVQRASSDSGCLGRLGCSASGLPFRVVNPFLLVEAFGFARSLCIVLRFRGQLALNPKRPKQYSLPKAAGT